MTRVEGFFVVLVLLLAAGAFESLWVVPGQTQSAAGVLLMQVLWAVIYTLTLYLFLRHCEKPFRSFVSEWPLIVLCMFAMVSIFWSQAPGLTFRRSVALLLTLLFGIYFGSRFSSKEQLRLLAWTCGICIFFSSIFGLLGLGTSVDAGSGVPGWYGIFDQKNSLGRIMVLSALVFLFWKRTAPEHKGLANTGFLASVVLILLSRSMTSVLVLVLLLALLHYLKWTLRKGVRWMIAGISFLVLTGTASLFYVATHLQEVTGLLGKSATLTGRIQIWILSTVMALRQPWLGYGYNAFWLPNEWYTARIWQVAGWNVPHAHDGLLELWLELGIIGAGLFLLVFVYYVLRGVASFRQNLGAGAAAWPLIFLLYLFLSNLTESSLLSRNSILFVLYAATAVATQQKEDDAPVRAGAAVQQQGLA